MRVARVLASCSSLSAAVLWLLSGTARADDYHTFHPMFNARSTLSDRSTTTGMQPWIWTATAGDASTGILLAGKQADNSAPSAWTYTFAQQLTSAPDAVSWTSGTTPVQRIFYTSANKLVMLNWDNNVQNSFTNIAPPANITIPVGDIAALTWVPSGAARRMVVASYAAKSGVNGFLCFWEQQADAASWTSACTSSAVMSATNDPLPDISGVMQGSTPEFFFRNAAGKLGRARRTGTAAFTIEEVGVDQIGPSVSAFNSQVSGNIDVEVVRTSDSRVRMLRYPSTSVNAVTFALPALPNGAVAVTNSAVVLSGGSYPISSTSNRTQLAVIDTALRLHTIRTTDNAGLTFEAAWTAGVVPGRGTTTAPEQIVSALGPTIGNPPGNGSRLFFVAAGAIGSDWASVLGEYWWGFPRPFTDHGRFSFGGEGLDTPTTGATESSVAAAPVEGIATAIQRNNPTPWEITAAGTDDNGSSFAASTLLAPAFEFPGGPQRSQSDPNAGHGGIGGHALHFAALELTINAGCAPDDSTGIVTYRRGFAAGDIINTINQVVATASGTPQGVDHPGIGITVDNSDNPTAHVAYWEVGNNVKYWFLSPGDVVNGPFTIPTASLPSNAPGVSVGNFQSQVFVWSFPAFGNGFPTICRMNGSNMAGLVCGRSTAAKAPTSKVISYGAPITQAGTTCPTIAGKLFKCFDNAQPAAIYADPTASNRIHIAYQAPSSASASRLSIWYTHNTDSNLSAWTAPVEIGTDSTRDCINPAITIDYDGQIVVTYSRILQATTASGTNGVADTVVAWSTVDGSTWHNSGQVVSNWDADVLPFHCSRAKWFLGEYRYGDVVAGRAEQLLNSSGATLSEKTMWFSRALNLQ